jgi:hypothetical protein
MHDHALKVKHISGVLCTVGGALVITVLSSCTLFLVITVLLFFLHLYCRKLIFLDATLGSISSSMLYYSSVHILHTHVIKKMKQEDAADIHSGTTGRTLDCRSLSPHPGGSEVENSLPER